MRSTIDVDLLRELRGIMVFDSAHESIGTIEEIFYDEATTRPLWVGVAADRPGTSRMLLPLEAASIGDGGLTLRYTKEYVRRAPLVAGDIGRAGDQELRAYYGLTPRDLSGDIRSLT
jgi:hypothetical protein